jgi:hypothetical protein
MGGKDVTMAVDHSKDVLSRKEASEYLASLGWPVAHQTLANMASNNNALKGPPFVRFRWNRVAYRREDLDEWVRRQSTKIG